MDLALPVLTTGKYYAVRLLANLPSGPIRQTEGIRKMPRLFATLLLCTVISHPLAAQDNLTDRQRVEQMVRINSNGLLSITYQVKWPWEKAAYGQSLYNVWLEDMMHVESQCRDIKGLMANDPELRLNPALHNATQSLFSEGEIHHILLMNAILKKYVGLFPVDPETTKDQGTFQPVLGAECSSEDYDAGNIGMIQQMLVRFEEPFQSEVVQGICSWSKKTASCLRDIHTISEKRMSSATKEVGMKPPEVLQHALLVP